MFTNRQWNSKVKGLFYSFICDFYSSLSKWKDNLFASQMEKKNF